MHQELIEKLKHFLDSPTIPPGVSGPLIFTTPSPVGSAEYSSSVPGVSG